MLTSNATNRSPTRKPKPGLAIASMRPVQTDESSPDCRPTPAPSTQYCDISRAP